MNADTNRSSQPDARIVFLQDFFKRPRQVGSIIPSSHFLERRIVRCAELRDASAVVELGPGTGGTTRALLRAMEPDTRLLVIEINRRFAQVLRNSVHDPRLSVCRGNAARITEILEEHDCEAPEVVLSGIPFSTMPYVTGIEILQAVQSIGYRALPYNAEQQQASRQRERRRQLRRLLIAGLFGMQVMMLSISLYAGAWTGIDAEFNQLFRWLCLALTLPVLGYSGLPFFSAAWRDLRQRQVGMAIQIRPVEKDW